MPRTDEVKPTRRPTATAPAAAGSSSIERIARLIQKRAQFFVESKETAAVIAKQASNARDELIDLVAQAGQKDDKGNSWFKLSRPIKFTNEAGKAYVYTDLKRERHLSPANPQPIPERAEELLKRKKKWVKKSDQDLIDQMQMDYPFLTFTVEVNVEALSTAGYFGGLLSDAEYNSLLPEQVESFQFKPVEA